MSPTEKHASDAAASDRADSSWDISLNLPRKPDDLSDIRGFHIAGHPPVPPCTYSYTAKLATLSQTPAQEYIAGHGST